MAKEVRCADVGLDCDFIARAGSSDELLARIVTHAAEVHGITEITPDLHAKLASVIKDVPDS